MKKSAVTLLRAWPALALAYLLAPSTAHGADFAEQPLAWHGFFTGGGQLSDSNQPYFYGLARETSLSRLSRLGLALEKRLDERWELGAQILANDREVTPDWAFVTYYPVTNLTFRLGRQKTPMWLISDHLDVGHTYPWVSPPEEVYSLNPINSLNGLSASYRQPLGSAAVTIEAFVSGTGSQLYDLPTLDTAKTKNTTKVRNYSSANVSLENDHFLLRLAYAQASTAISTDEFVIDKLKASFYAVGFRGTYKNVLLLAEYAANSGYVDKGEMDRADSALLSAQTAMAAPGAAQNPVLGAALQKAYIQQAATNAKFVGGRGWYTTLAYQVGDFQPLLTFARLRSPKNSAAAGDQDSVSGGLRYDFNLNTDIKLQAQHIWPRHASRGLIDDLSVNGAPASYHQLNIYSAAINVAF